MSDHADKENEFIPGSKFTLLENIERSESKGKLILQEGNNNDQVENMLVYDNDTKNVKTNEESDKTSDPIKESG